MTEDITFKIKESKVTNLICKNFNTGKILDNINYLDIDFDDLKNIKSILRDNKIEKLLNDKEIKNYTHLKINFIDKINDDYNSKYVKYSVDLYNQIEKIFDLFVYDKSSNFNLIIVTKVNYVRLIYQSYLVIKSIDDNNIEIIKSRS